MSKPKSARKQPLTEAQKAGLGKGLIVRHQRKIKKAIEAAKGGRR
jgi:hypothetical protein